MLGLSVLMLRNRLSYFLCPIFFAIFYAFLSLKLLIGYRKLYENTGYLLRCWNGYVLLKI